MKNTLLILTALILASVTFAAGSALADPNDPTDEDRAAVIAVARDYIDGWYEGDAERMANALHPDMAKRTIRTMKNGADLLNTVTTSNMIEYTKAGYGTQSKQEGQQNEVIVLDLQSQTASLKSVSHEFIDYLHLAKINGKWWIVNVVWEQNK